MSLDIRHVTTTISSPSGNPTTHENRRLTFHICMYLANGTKIFTVADMVAGPELGEDTIIVSVKNGKRIEMKILDASDRERFFAHIADAFEKKHSKAKPAPIRPEAASPPVVTSARRRSHGNSIGGSFSGENRLNAPGSAGHSAPAQVSPLAQKRTHEMAAHTTQPRSSDANAFLASVAAAAVGRNYGEEREQEHEAKRQCGGGSFLDRLPTATASPAGCWSGRAQSSSSGMTRAPPPVSGMAQTSLRLFRRPSCPQESSSYQRYRSSETFGLRNLGNTCYFNATMQALCSLREFVMDLARMVENVPETSRGELYRSTVDIFKQMSSSSNAAGAAAGPLSPAQLRALIARGCPMFRGNEQQDAHEFFLEYLNQLHDELLAARSKWLEGKEEGTGDTAVVATQMHFDSEVNKVLVCEACGKGRNVSERFMDFSLDFDGQSDVDDCTLHSMLESYFSDEILEAKCEHCGESKASMTKRMTSFPRVLVLHLKRFMPNFVKQRYDKHHQNVVIDESLDLGVYAAQSEELVACQNADCASPPKPSSLGRMPARPLANMADSPPVSAGADIPVYQGITASPATNVVPPSSSAHGSPAGSSARGSPAKMTAGGVARGQYKLRSIVTHDGPSPHSGHYVTYACGAGGVWRLYDDSVVRELPKTFEPQQELGRRAYILYYVLQN